MKTAPENKKKLSTIKKALLLGIPLSGVAAAATCFVYVDRPVTQGMAEIPEERSPEERCYPPPAGVPIERMIMEKKKSMGILVNNYEVQAGDTWESLAKRYETTVEIMMRINDISPKTVNDVIKTKKIPEKLKLRPGCRIYIPVAVRESYQEGMEKLRREVERLRKERQKSEKGKPSPASPDKPKK